jgi:hypothetical protein
MPSVGYNKCKAFLEQGRDIDVAEFIRWFDTQDQKTICSEKAGEARLVVNGATCICVNGNVWSCDLQLECCRTTSQPRFDG